MHLVKSWAYPFAHLHRYTILLTYHRQNSIFQLPNSSALSSTINQLQLFIVISARKKIHTFVLIGVKQDIDSYIKKKNWEIFQIDVSERKRRQKSAKKWYNLYEVIYELIDIRYFFIALTEQIEFSQSHILSQRLYRA